MKIKRVVLILLSLFLLIVHSGVRASYFSPEDVVRLPFNSEIIDRNEENVINLSTALVGRDQHLFISYTIPDTNYIHQIHPATAEVPGICGPQSSWFCTYFGAANLNNYSLSNVVTSRYGPDTFGVAVAYEKDGASEGGWFIEGFAQEFKNNMKRLDLGRHTKLIKVSKFGDRVHGAPSIVRIGNHYRMAVVIKTVADFPTYKLVYMQYVGGSSNTSCSNFPSGYQCDVIEETVNSPISSPSLAYVNGKTGIAYVKGNAVRYAYPWNIQYYPPGQPANCGTEDNPWRCIDIVNPNEGRVGDRVALAYGSDNTHAEIVFSKRPATNNMLMRATYVGSGGDCGQDGKTPGLNPQPIYRWSCADVDAFIDNIADTTFAVAFDPNDFPVVSWNNKFIGDTAQRLYISYPAARVGEGPGWKKQLVDGNAYSTTGIWNDIVINSAGLTSLAYMQPVYKECEQCSPDESDNLLVSRQFFKTFLPLIQK